MPERQFLSGITVLSKCIPTTKVYLNSPIHLAINLIQPNWSPQAATEEEHSNQGHQSPYAGPSMGSPVKVLSEVVASDRDGPLLRKLRNIHSFELERRLGLESKPSPERFLEAWSVHQPPLSPYFHFTGYYYYYNYLLLLVSDLHLTTHIL